MYYDEERRLQIGKELVDVIVKQCDEMEPKIRPIFTQAKINDKVVVSAEIPAIPTIQKPCYYVGEG